MKRIWTKEELESADFGKFDCFGDFFPFEKSNCITKDMFGKSVQWCKEKNRTVLDWMIAKPIKQEPKEGDLVYVWDEDKKRKEKRMFLSKVKYGCICVDGGCEKYYNDKKQYTCTVWKHYEPIPKLTPQEIADKVGLTVEELRGIVNG